MSDRQPKARRHALSRRSFLQSAGLGGMALLGGSSGWPAPASAAAMRRQPATLPIEHVIISCQENRSFDHYFGFAPQVQAAGFGPPPGYSQPDGNGGAVVPFEFTALSTDDIGHSWSDVHGEWNSGAMDGFFTTDGNAAMGYYTAAELPFYYSLLDEFTLCGNYFCSLLGPTWPNRFYFAAGTSGGITTNGVWGFGVFDYPIILDLLDAAGVTWKVYNNTWDSVPFGNTDNVLQMLAAQKKSASKKANAKNPRSNRSAAKKASVKKTVKKKVSKKGATKKSAKRWSAGVTRNSNALDLEPHVFEESDPTKIARSLKRSADKSTRKKGTPFQSAMSMLNFYVNRAGKNLPKKQVTVLENAKEQLRKLYGKEEK